MMNAQERARQADARARRESAERQLREEIGQPVEDTSALPGGESGHAEEPGRGPSVRDSWQRRELPSLGAQSPPRVLSQSDALPTQPPSAVRFELPASPDAPITAGSTIGTNAMSALETRIRNQQAHIQRLEADLTSTKVAVQQLRQSRTNAEQDRRRATLNNEQAEAEKWKKLTERFAGELEEKNAHLEWLEQRVEEGRTTEADLHRRLHEARLKQMDSDAEIEALRFAARASLPATPRTQASPSVVSPATTRRLSDSTRRERRVLKISVPRGQRIGEVALISQLI